jgi:hypothetical protein
MKFLSFLNWSLLVQFSRTLIGKAFFIISLLPILLYLIRSLNFFSGEFLIKYDLSIIGSLIYLLISVIIYFISPKLIRAYPTEKIYKDQNKEDLGAINLQSEFRDLECLSQNTKESILQITKRQTSDWDPYFPIDSAIQTFKKEELIYIYTHYYYTLINNSYPGLRLIISILLFSSIISIYFPIIYNLIKYIK